LRAASRVLTGVSGNRHGDVIGNKIISIQD
jgi:hypothetical protein